MRKEANPFHPICMLRIAMARVFLMKLKGKEREGSINSTVVRSRVCTRRIHDELNAKSLSKPGVEGLSRTMSQLRGLHGAKIIRAGE